MVTPFVASPMKTVAPLIFTVALVRLVASMTTLLLGAAFRTMDWLAAVSPYTPVRNV